MIERFKDYQMNEKELQECEEIIKCFNKYKESYRYLDIGYPIVSFDQIQGKSFGSIMCIEQEYGFKYYLFKVSICGCISCIDFEEEYKKNKYAEIERPVGFDGFLWYLLSEVDGYGKFILYKGFITKPELCDNGKYRFSKMHGYGSGMANDGVDMIFGYEDPIFEKVRCFSCKHEFYFPDGNIPVGEKYEVHCPKCMSKVWRKKI